MSGMVEKVARALSADIDEGLPRFTAQRWEDLSLPAKATLLKRARAAIQAIRDFDFANSALWEYPYAQSDTAGQFEERWRDLFDAALTEKVG